MIDITRNLIAMTILSSALAGWADEAPEPKVRSGVEEIEDQTADKAEVDAESLSPAPKPLINSQEAVQLRTAAETRKTALIAAASEEAYHFTPKLRDAFLAYARSKTSADLAAAGKKIPDDFLAWVDHTPNVAASVYGSRMNCANILLMLYSLKLDLGPERFEKYHQLALAMAIVHSGQGPQASLAPRAPLQLVIPDCRLKPVNTKDSTRTLDANDHIINFLDEHPVTNDKGSRPLTAAELMSSQDLQKEFNAYMESKGCKVSIDCGNRVIFPKRTERVTGQAEKQILKAFRILRDAYIAKGLLPAKADPSPSPAQNCLFLIRNAEMQVKRGKLPNCPLTSPWPILTLLCRDMKPLREQEDIWHRYQTRGEVWTYGEYTGPIAQQPDIQAARRLSPLAFPYGSVQMMMKDGGVCGTMAKIAAFSYKALGVPASTAGQPGHCAVIYFARDQKSGSFQCSGSQFVTAGPKDTNVLTPWDFGERPSNKKMVYHQSIAWAVSHNFDAYLDSTIAWQIYRTLPEAIRKEHGLELLESGLALNPYNLLLVDSAADAATTPELKNRLQQSFAAALGAVTKPGCPKGGLYPDTVKEKIRKGKGK